MIDYVYFAQKIEVFCELFGRKLSDTAISEYHRTIADFLTAEEFEEIYETLLTEAEFFPVPATFLKYAKKRSEDEASRSWERVHHWVCGGYLDRDRMVAMRKDLGGTLLAIVGEIGGVYRLANATESEMAMIKKEFIAAYKDQLLKVNLKALPEGKS